MTQPFITCNVKNFILYNNNIQSDQEVLYMYVSLFLIGKFTCIDIIYYLDQPSIENIPLEIVNESSAVSLKREISSNPLSNVSWYRVTELLITQIYVSIATLYIGQAKCTDTQNFTILASNGIEHNISVSVELIVNCKY